jgi:hypothetical protein
MSILLKICLVYLPLVVEEEDMHNVVVHMAEDALHILDMEHFLQDVEISGLKL